MQTFPLGKVFVMTAGTPTTLASALPANFPADHKFHKLIVSQVFGTTGRICFGTTTVLAATLAGTIKEFFPTAATGLADTFTLCGGLSNELNATDYAVDATVNSEGVLISAVVA